MLNFSCPKLPKSPLLLSVLISLFGSSANAQQLEAPKDPDPWQGFNRGVFAFNEVLDKCCLKPLAIGYKAVMPDPLEVGVSNIFANVKEVPNILNGLLQADFGGAAHDTGRFLVNSTLGVGGLLDVAQYMHLPKDDDEDFGQTLAVWGVGSGPYLVLPLFGPSTLRDGVARPVDWYSNPLTYIEHDPTENATTATALLTTRAGLLDLEKNIVGDKYVFFRDVYLQRRDYLIHNGEVVDDFGSGDFGSDDFGAEDFDSADFGAVDMESETDETSTEDQSAVLERQGKREVTAK